MIGVAAELWQSTADISAGHQGPATPNRCSGLHTKPQLYGTLQDELEQRALMGHLFLRQWYTHLYTLMYQRRRKYRGLEHGLQQTGFKLRVSPGEV